MYYSIRGKIIKIDKKFLVVEANGIGYEILFSKPKNYEEGKEVFLYLYHHITEDSEFLVGFDNNEDKEAFKLLLHVNGIGPKGAINILSKLTYRELLAAISSNNVETIESVQGISNKTAMQVILDLRDYISRNNQNSENYSEIRNALKRLKFSVKDIDKVLPYIYTSSGTKEDILKEALRRLQNA